MYSNCEDHIPHHTYKQYPNKHHSNKLVGVTKGFTKKGVTKLSFNIIIIFLDISSVKFVIEYILF